MDFYPDVEDEFIRYAVSHKLDRPLVNTPNKVWRDSTKTKTPPSPFKIGDSLRYTDVGHNEMVDLVYIKTSDTESTKYIIKFLRGITMIVTKEFLKSRNVTDIGSIPIYPNDYINKSENLTQ